MRAIKYSLAMLILMGFLVSGCSNSESPVQSKKNEISVQPKAAQKEFIPVYKIIGEKDVSTGYAVRKTIQISLPMGLDRKAVEDNLVQAAKDAEKKYAKTDKGLAIDTYAFSDEDVKLINKGEYVKTFAECTYAHNGEWTNSTIKYSSSTMKAKITINNEAYFSVKG